MALTASRQSTMGGCGCVPCAIVVRGKSTNRYGVKLPLPRGEVSGRGEDHLIQLASEQLQSARRLVLDSESEYSVNKYCM